MFFLFKHNKLKSNYLSFLHLTAFNHDFTKAVKWKDFMYPAMLFLLFCVYHCGKSDQRYLFEFLCTTK